MGNLEVPAVTDILIIAESDEELQRLKALIVEKGIEVKITIALGISKGIDILSQNTFNLILLAPLKNLSSHLEAIRKIVIQASNAAVIVLTDDYDPDLAPCLARHGVQDYLPVEWLDEKWIWRCINFSLHRKPIFQKEAESCKLSGEQFSLLLTLSGFGYFEVDLKGNLTVFNEIFIELVGYSRKELMGMNYRQFTDPESVPIIFHAFQQVFTTGQPQCAIEYTVHRSNGECLHLDCSCSLIKSKTGEATGFRGITQDISKRKHAEAALRESEARYRTLLEGIEYGYFEMDLKGRFTYFNDAMCKISGYSKSELMGRNLRKEMDDENSENLKNIFSLIYTSGKINRDIYYSRKRKDGKVVCVECSASLKYDENDQPVGFRGIAKDVTERVKAEERLRQSEQRYRDILDSIEDAYYEIDLNGRLTFFNDAMCDLHGYSPDELKLISFKNYTSEEDWPALIDAHMTVLKTKKSIKNFQLKTISKNGDIRYIESSISLMEDAEGNPTGFHGITRDITTRKNVELELQTAKDQAEAATKAKSEFLANMSHEIRTPMNGVIGMYNLLLSTELTSEQTDYVLTGKRSADGLLVIINDILDFSKIEAGKLDLDVMDFDLRKAMHEAVELPALQARQKGLEFDYYLDADIPSDLRGDPGRVKQILTNLCNNALKFTSNGGIAIRVTSKNENGSQILVRFEIKDTGIGISENDQKMLFNSFQQVDASTTRKYGGTGLGLAICKKLAELMQGRIGADSEMGSGSTFWFEIPFEKQPQATAQKLQLPENIRNKRILIVDDNKTNLDIISGYLTAWGCHCETAKNAEIALTLMHAMAKVNAAFDLVVIDMYMPETDGAQLGQMINDDPHLKDTPLVMLTAQGVRGDAARMKHIGFKAYLTKPIRRSQLFDCLAMVLGRTLDATDMDNTTIITRHSLSEARRKNIRILLVEDNIVNRKLALRLLEKFGFATDAVVNGKKAITALESTHYDLVLMDLQMPEMDGMKATEIIRDPNSKVLNHDIPIIAMTAHAMKGDRELCLRAGMDDYVSKPIEPEMMFAAIDRQIQNRTGKNDASQSIA